MPRLHLWRHTQTPSHSPRACAQPLTSGSSSLLLQYLRHSYLSIAPAYRPRTANQGRLRWRAACVLAVHSSRPCRRERSRIQSLRITLPRSTFIRGEQEAARYPMARPGLCPKDRRIQGEACPRTGRSCGGRCYAGSRNFIRRRRYSCARHRRDSRWAGRPGSTMFTVFSVTRSMSVTGTLSADIGQVVSLRASLRPIHRAGFALRG